MAWTDIARRERGRAERRYSGYLTDREWALIALPAKSGGRPRTTDLREVMNAGLYLATTGCQWRMLPQDFPPLSTVLGYFYDWRNMGLFETINHFRVMGARDLEGREASPTAGVIDSQAGDKLRQALKGYGNWTIEIIKCSDTAKGFEVLPKRWVVERTLAWPGRCRRLAEDWEKSVESSTACVMVASIRMLARRIARYRI